MFLVLRGPFIDKDPAEQDGGGGAMAGCSGKASKKLDQP